jgi:hypothetical protein
MRALKILCIFVPTVVLAVYATVARGQGASTPNWVTQLRPIELGTSGGNLKDDYARSTVCCSGTLGALVEDDSGNFYILSCNHVLAKQNQAPRGTIVTQPGLVDADCTLGKSNAVATLTTFVPLKTKGMVDAALAQITSTNDVDVSGSIIIIGQTSTNTFVPPLGSVVAKSGRTTGYTTGIVAAIDATLTVGYTPCNLPNKKKPTMRTFTNQIIVTPPSFGGFNFGGEGDSGSLVVEYNPDITGGTTNVDVGVTTNLVNGVPIVTVVDVTNVVGGVTNEFPRVAGVLFAGSSTTVAVNPIDPVLAELGARLGATLHMVGATNAPPAEARASAGEESYGLALDSYKKAVAIKSATEDQILKIPGVVGIGIGQQTGNPTEAAVEILVDEDTPELQAVLPTSIDGLPVQIVQTGTFVAR